MQWSYWFRRRLKLTYLKTNEITNLQTSTVLQNAPLYPLFFQPPSIVLMVLLTFDLKRLIIATNTSIAAFHAFVINDNCFLTAKVELKILVPTLTVRRGIAAFSRTFVAEYLSFIFEWGDRVDVENAIIRGELFRKASPCCKRHRTTIMLPDLILKRVQEPPDFLGSYFRITITLSTTKGLTLKRAVWQQPDFVMWRELSISCCIVHKNRKNAIIMSQCLQDSLESHWLFPIFFSPNEGSPNKQQK